MPPTPRPAGARRPRVPTSLRALPLAAALLAACGDGSRSDDDAPPRRPDVILIVLDTLRADRCGFAGAAQSATPRLDAFARECTTYRDAWTPAGWTGPAHASLFTGLRPEHHGFLMDRRESLAAGAVTLAELLRDAGYRTACLSANPVISDEFGLTQGFEPTPRLPAGANQPLPPATAAYTPALRFAELAHAADQPYFLFVNAIDPHLTYDPPDDYVARVAGDAPEGDVRAARAWDTWSALDDLVGIARVAPAVGRLLPRLYTGEVAWTDAQTGDFLDGLRARRLLDDALVVVASDHGEYLGENGLWAHRVGLDAAIGRIPLLVRRPGMRGAGAVVDDVVRLEDVFPTVLELCGVAAPEGLDGESLERDVAGRVARAMRGSQLHLLEKLRESHPSCASPALERVERGVYDGRHHLVERSDDTLTLYDLADDPREAFDIAAQRPDVVARLHGLLPAWPDAR